MFNEFYFDSPHQLRDKLVSFGYKILREREIANGYQFYCDHEVSAVWYRTGRTIPQGKRQAVLERQLSEDAGEPTTFMRNRVMIVYGELEAIAVELGEQLRKGYGLDPAPIHLTGFSDNNIIATRSEHLPFTQIAMIVAKRKELRTVKEFEQLGRDLELMVGRSRTIAIVNKPVKGQKTHLPPCTSVFCMGEGGLNDILDSCVERIMRGADMELQSLIRSHAQLRQNDESPLINDTSLPF